MLVTKMLHIDVKYEFFISVYGIAVTAIFFGAVLFVTLLLNLGRLHVQKPVELLRQGNVGEREPKTRWLLTILGVLSLGGGYYIAITTHNSVQAIELFYEEYPEYRDVLHIHSFDGMGYNALYGSPVVHAAQMCADGASLEAIL